MTDNNPHPESDNKQQDVPAVPAFTKEDLLARISKTQTLLSDDNPDLPPVLTFTQEAIIKRMAEAQTQFRQQHPELPESDTDLKLSSEWWKPMFALNTAVDESLPKDVNDKLQAASKEFASAKYSSDALDRFASQARVILAGFDEVMQLLEGTVFKDPGVWDKMHEHVVSKQKKGGDS